MMSDKLFDVVSIFDSIKETSGRNDKEIILGRHEDNTLFREMLNFLYNPFIVTGIGFKKLIKFSDISFRDDKVAQFNDITEAMSYLKKNNTGKEVYVRAVANFINQHTGRVHDFLQEFFTDDVKIGVTASTINKVYGKNTIPKHEVMLAESLTEYMDYIEGQEHVTLMKYDGVRCTAVKRNGETLFLTRKGFPITGLIQLEGVFEALSDNMVCEGELIVSNYEDLKSKDAYKATNRIVRKDGDKIGISFIAFDLIPVEEFDNGESSLGYLERLDELSQEVINIVHLSNSSLIEVAQVLYFGDDITETLKLAEKAIEDGQEGLVIRKADAKYVTKRSKDLLRIKDINTADLRIVDVEEGTKKSTIGRLGAIVVGYKGYRVNVGSGFKAHERDEMWANKDSLIGQIAEIIYTEETSNDKGGLSLRFPRFKGVRWDKNEADFE